LVVPGSTIGQLPARQLIRQNGVDMILLDQSEHGCRLVDTDDRDARIFAQQLFEPAAQDWIGGKNGDGDHGSLAFPRYAAAPSGSRLGHGPLADDDLDCRWNSAPYQSQIDSAARAVRPEELHDFAHAIDWLLIPSHD